MGARGSPCGPGHTFLPTLLLLGRFGASASSAPLCPVHWRQLRDSREGIRGGTAGFGGLAWSRHPCSSGLQDRQASLSPPCLPPVETQNVSECHDRRARLGGRAALLASPCRGYR